MDEDNKYSFFSSVFKGSPRHEEGNTETLLVRWSCHHLNSGLSPKTCWIGMATGLVRPSAKKKKKKSRTYCSKIKNFKMVTAVC